MISSVASSPGGYLHTHTLTVLLADLSAPPAGGVTYTTGSSEGHTHQVTISPTDLGELQAGRTVVESSTLVLAHEHTFSITKP